MWISTEKHAGCWRTEQFAMASYMDLAIEDGDLYSYHGILRGISCFAFLNYNFLSWLTFGGHCEMVIPPFMEVIWRHDKETHQWRPMAGWACCFLMTSAAVRNAETLESENFFWSMQKGCDRWCPRSFAIPISSSSTRTENWGLEGRAGSWWEFRHPKNLSSCGLFVIQNRKWDSSYMSMGYIPLHSPYIGLKKMVGNSNAHWIWRASWSLLWKLSKFPAEPSLPLQGTSSTAQHPFCLGLGGDISQGIQESIPDFFWEKRPGFCLRTWCLKRLGRRQRRRHPSRSSKRVAAPDLRITLKEISSKSPNIAGSIFMWGMVAQL